jgi:hypothetical protein
MRIGSGIYMGGLDFVLDRVPTDLLAFEKRPFHHEILAAVNLQAAPTENTEGPTLIIGEIKYRKRSPPAFLIARLTGHAGYLY